MAPKNGVLTEMALFDLLEQNFVINEDGSRHPNYGSWVSGYPSNILKRLRQSHVLPNQTTTRKKAS
jgi:hypothetical protein